MKCPNPACGRDIFKVRVVHKQIIKDLPMLPVELTCTHCNRKVKAWVTNQNLKDLHSLTRALLEGQKLLFETLEEVLEKRKGFLASLKERFDR